MKWLIYLNFRTLIHLFIFFISMKNFCVKCFNIENRDPFVKKAPEGQKSSYFGFSVALHKTRENSHSTTDSWLLVGAPLGQNLQPNTNFSGALFKCPITKRDQDCVQVRTDGHRLDEFDYEDDGNNNDEDGNSNRAGVRLKPPGVDEIKNGQWLGVTVRSQKPGGVVMVCAHRYIQSPNLNKFHYGQGICYLLNQNLVVDETLQYCKNRLVDKLHQQYGFCQIGTSASFVGDDFAVIGAPGPYTWRGTLFGKVVVGDYLERDKTIYRGPLNDNPTPIDKYSYLGMSVGGGHFFDKQKYVYVAGAPRSQMIGQVYFFEQIKSIEELNVSLIITGQQFASSFGYEILVVDLNNDDFDDLLVAAPFYYNEQQGGAVYIYSNLKECTDNKFECPHDHVLYGTAQSRFGFAMSAIGDINKDGFNDVAIGAPYENGHGAVYIYLGTSDGIASEPSQKIFFKQLTTFGNSLSGGLDMDNNGYPDLLVGAYEADRALLFLTRPIIDIKIKIISNDMNNINASKKGCDADRRNLNNTCFSIRSCFNIVGELAQSSSNEFSVIYNISEISKFSRIWFQDRKFPDKRATGRTLTISINNENNHNKERNYCQDEVVYIKERVRDILSPIKFRVKYTLEDDKYHTPILNKSSIKEFEATFQKNCGADDRCISNLNLKAWTNLNKNSLGEYTVNSTNDEFVLHVNAENLGEPAYEAKLYFWHSNALSFIKQESDGDQQPKCSLKTALIICSLGNPFQAKANTTMKFRFEIIKNTKEQKLDIHLKVNSTSEEISKNTEIHLVTILQKIAEFSVSSKGTSNLFYGGNVIGESSIEHLEDIGASVTHQYIIYNNGEWNLPMLSVNIKWPYQVPIGRRPGEIEGKWLLYLEDIPKIRGTEVGFCDVEEAEKTVNPIKLIRRNIVVDELENLEEKPIMTNDHYDDNLNSTTVVNDEEDEDERKRRRRSVDNGVVESQIVDKGGIKRKITIMDCLLGTAKCIDIKCYIKSIQKQGQVTVEIKSRIWNSTLVEDYSNVDWVQIKSTASINIEDKTFITKSDQMFIFNTETLLYPETIPPYTGINWWIIGGAILAGLLLLIVLIVILYKCGFFKRKRISKDPTLSGNLLSKDENDILLKGSDGI